MTFDVVLDSCVLAKTVLDEPDSHLAAELIESVMKRRDEVYALDIALVEVTNVIWKSCRRQLIDDRKAHQIFAELMSFTGVSVPSRPLLSRGLQLAMQYQIAVYDALFVAAVEQLDCRGVTSDATLVQRVQKDFAGIELLN